jgi:hypothetical protein
MKSENAKQFPLDRDQFLMRSSQNEETLKGKIEAIADSLSA